MVEWMDVLEMKRPFRFDEPDRPSPVFGHEALLRSTCTRTGGMKCAIDADGYDFDERIPLLSQCQNVCNEQFMNMDTIFVARSGRLEINLNVNM